MHMAYIDPGSGAIVLQLLMAVVLGASVYFRRAIARVLGIGQRRKEKEIETDKES